MGEYQWKMGNGGQAMTYKEQRQPQLIEARNNEEGK